MKASRRRMRIVATFAFVLLACGLGATAQVFSLVYNFGANSGDPTNPYAPCVVVQGPDGNLYGTTPTGGTSNYGTVFKITPAGALTVLYMFDITHGEYPFSGLTLGKDGNLYGTTVFGGTSGNGVVFKITRNGGLAILHEFTGKSDGAYPYAPPIQGADGNFYGTTSKGAFGWGTVYKISLSGVFSLLHPFNSADGSFPQGPLIQATDGALYGTTREGGRGYGTVFRTTTDGSFKMLYAFDNAHGLQPEGGLVQFGDGAFYGTTVYGGANTAGVIYKITPSGLLTVLHNFALSDGTTPFPNLLLASDNKFYGATEGGGSMGFGTIYRFSGDAQDFAVLYNFDGATGANPYVTLLQHTSGMLYGETEAGGAYGYGTVYSLDIGLGPFVSLVSNVGRVGKSVEILGQGFTGTTRVSFNGASAVFQLVSDSFLTATVPSGATDGFVSVTTSHGVLTSNKIFWVQP